MTLRSPVVVGRAAELATLTGVLAAPAQDPIVVLVEGEGGLGKSRLVAEACAGVAAQITVVYGAAYAGGADIPLLPWSDALRDLVRRWGPAAVAEAAGSAAADFAVLLPELGSPGVASGRRVPDLLPWLWERLSERGPLVVVLEDLHAADPGTVEVLQRLARHGRGPLTVVVTARPSGDARDPAAASRWRDVSAELRRSGAVAIELAPLSTGAASELLGRLLAEVASPDGSAATDPERLAELAASGGGVPFVLEQLVEAQLGGGPLSPLPGDPVAASLLSLSAPATAVVAVLALHGGGVDHQLVSELLPEQTLLPALRECVDAGVVVVRGDGRYALRHALLAERARARLLPVELERWHALLAQALADRPQDRRAAMALPAHWEAAGRPREALLASVHAGDIAAFAPGVAAHHYRRAVALWPLVEDPHEVTGTSYDDLVERAAAACAQAGDVEAAVALARDWLSGDAHRRDPARASRLALLVAARGEWTLPEQEVSRAFAQAVQWAGEADGANLAAALTGQARHLAALDRNAEAEPVARRALQAADPGSAEAAYAGAALGAVLAHLGDHEAGMAVLLEAVAGLAGAGHEQESARTVFELVWTEFYAGHAEAALTRAIETSQTLGRAGLVRDIGASLLGTAAQLACWLGRSQQARDLLDRGTREDPAGLGHASRLVARGELALRGGDLNVAARHFAEYVAHWEELGLRAYDHLGLCRSAETAAARGDHAAAAELLAEGLAAIAGADTAYEMTSVARSGGYVLAESVRRGVAAPPDLVAGVTALADRVTAIGRLAADSVPAAELATCRAELARVAGQPASALWSGAADDWGRLGFVWWETLSRLRYAEALLLSRGARATASPVVAKARQRAVELGAAGLVALADDLTRDAGLAAVDVPSPRTAPEASSAAPALTSLTTREREVLALLVEGLSNRAIAQRLYISEKTASVHVSNILAKLGVHSRLQAAAVARRNG
jgi:DNA-binding CsgD family transcriptional regulator